MPADAPLARRRWAPENDWEPMSVQELRAHRLRKRAQRSLACRGRLGSSPPLVHWHLAAGGMADGFIYAGLGTGADDSQGGHGRGVTGRL